MMKPDLDPFAQMRYDVCQCTHCNNGFETDRDCADSIICLIGLYEDCTPEEDCETCAIMRSCCGFRPRPE